MMVDSLATRHLLQFLFGNGSERKGKALWTNAIKGMVRGLWLERNSYIFRTEGVLDHVHVPFGVGHMGILSLKQTV